MATMLPRFAGGRTDALRGGPGLAFGIKKLAAGKHTIRFDFVYEGGGIGKGAGSASSASTAGRRRWQVEYTVGRRFSLDETFDIGEDTGTAVIEDYVGQMPFRFTGKLVELVIELADPASMAAC